MGAQRTCGVWVVNIQTGQTVGFKGFESGVQEIFSVKVLPATRYPEILAWENPKMAFSYVLPDAALARRAVGSFANVLASADTRRVHAVAVASPGGSLLVSVRVPASASTSADAFCRSFGGGGRRIAAGIDALAPARLDELREALARNYPAPVTG